MFDEVITGFRVALGGAQERTGVRADLAVFAKAIAGGIALSAVTGSRSVMAPIADGRLAHNGTFNGNPIAMASRGRDAQPPRRAPGAALSGARPARRAVGGGARGPRPRG